MLQLTCSYQLDLFSRTHHELINEDIILHTERNSQTIHIYLSSYLSCLCVCVYVYVCVCHQLSKQTLRMAKSKASKSSQDGTGAGSTTTATPTATATATAPSFLVSKLPHLVVLVVSLLMAAWFSWSYSTVCMTCRHKHTKLFLQYLTCSLYR